VYILCVGGCGCVLFVCLFAIPLGRENSLSRPPPQKSLLKEMYMFKVCVCRVR
jgi:hypothetical protein